MSSFASVDVVLERFHSTYNLNVNLKKSDFVHLIYERNMPTTDRGIPPSTIAWSGGQES